MQEAMYIKPETHIIKSLMQLTITIGGEFSVQETL